MVKSATLVRQILLLDLFVYFVMACIGDISVTSLSQTSFARFIESIIGGVVLVFFFFVDIHCVEIVYFGFAFACYTTLQKGLRFLHSVKSKIKLCATYLKKRFLPRLVMVVFLF